MKKYLYNHTCEKSAYYVDNYPWGFRLKTQIRYWIETSEKANGGQRIVKQTMNPKTGSWCSPKKSTYRWVMFMFLDENEHVQTESLCMNSREKDILQFVETHKNNLDDFQKKQIRLLDGYKKAFSNIEFVVEPIPHNETKEQKDKREKEKTESLHQISKAIKYYTLKSEVI